MNSRTNEQGVPPKRSRSSSSRGSNGSGHHQPKRQQPGPSHTPRQDSEIPQFVNPADVILNTPQRLKTPSLAPRSKTPQDRPSPPQLPAAQASSSQTSPAHIIAPRLQLPSNHSSPKWKISTNGLFECTECGKKSKSEKGWKYHICVNNQSKKASGSGQRHANNKPKGKVPCLNKPQCEETFPQRSDMERHFQGCKKGYVPKVKLGGSNPIFQPIKQ